MVECVVPDPWLDDFRVFLERHTTVLRALPAWTLRIVVPPHLPEIGQRAKQVVWNQLLTPLREPRSLTSCAGISNRPEPTPAPSRCDDLDERFYEARDAFSAPRFKALYRMWKQDGDVALSEVGSRTQSTTPWTAGSGLVEALELGHRYGHLSPLVNVA